MKKKFLKDSENTDSRIFGTVYDRLKEIGDSFNTFDFEI